jgi:hypothetical protein
MRTILLIICLITVGFLFGQNNTSIEKDTTYKKYELTLSEVSITEFTPEEQDFLFYHTTPAYCFTAEFREKAVKKLQGTLKNK